MVRGGALDQSHGHSFKDTAQVWVSWQLLQGRMVSRCHEEDWMFRQLSKVPALTRNEFMACEIEIVEGVVISTPSTTHTFPHPPSSFETKPTALDGGAHKRNHTARVNEQNKPIIVKKKRARKVERKIINYLQTFFGVPERGVAKREARGSRSGGSR